MTAETLPRVLYIYAWFEIIMYIHVDLHVHFALR